MGHASKIEFVSSTGAIAEARTKFGGQPHWLGEPQWPLSRELGKPMRFIAQVRLSDAGISGAGEQMAYIFMTDEEDEFVDGTWDPESGENAVVIQPGIYSGSAAREATGPSLYEMVKKRGKHHLVPKPVEFAVALTRKHEPAFAPAETRCDWDEDKYDEYVQAMEGNKIGGAPFFIQGDEFPAPGEWQLLLQLDSTDVPFFVNFGDAGIAYVFVNADATEGKFLWQCA